MNKGPLSIKRYFGVLTPVFSQHLILKTNYRSKDTTYLLTI
jgi:hypothetical protein